MELENSSGGILEAKVIAYPKNKGLRSFKHKAIFEEENEIDLIEDEKIIIEENYNSVKYNFKMEKPESLDNLYSDNEGYVEIETNIKQQRFNREVIQTT